MPFGVAVVWGHYAPIPCCAVVLYQHDIVATLRANRFFSMKAVSVLARETLGQWCLHSCYDRCRSCPPVCACCVRVVLMSVAALSPTRFDHLTIDRVCDGCGASTRVSVADIRTQSVPCCRQCKRPWSDELRWLLRGLDVAERNLRARVSGVRDSDGPDEVETLCGSAPT